MKSNPARTGSRALLVALVAGLATQAHAGPGSVLDPQGVAQPTYYANSPQLRKFVDTLPGLGQAGANNLGSYLPVAVPDTTTYPGADYYEIAIVEYTQRLHTDLQKATKLRGYVQKIAGVNGTPMYLGPVIVAHRDRPVRVKVFNELQTGIPFFIPVDATVMGAGKGNLQADGVTPCDPLDPAQAPLCASYSEQRVGVHLHGGLTPWISDGLPHQWIAPAGDPSPYKVGVGARDVPDMAQDQVNYLPSGGAMSLYYPNQQSGRLMFYHDHAYGLTRLNVYAGVAAGYLLRDDVETALTAGVEDLPLVVQDKSFVPSDIAVQDSKWDLAKWGQPGDLWFPHMYEENQDPTCSWDINCMNPLGRWDYGPWIWPPVQLPGNPVNPSAALTASIVPEAFMDVMMVNGTVYPKAVVQPKAYRLRILNASNDRFLNLQLYYAIKGATFDTTRRAYFDRVTGTACIGAAGTPAECTEVAMVPRNGDTYTTVWGDDSTVPFDGRPGGVPNPVNAGPKMFQIATEGGLLPAAVLKNAPPIPVTYDTDPKSMTVGNVIDGTLILGPAERAEVVVDFSQVPAGSTLILYNDAPAAYPAGDQRYDYYTFGPSWVDAGGAPSPEVGKGPNTRTVMQFVVDPAGTPAAAYDFAALQAAMPAAYAASQEKPLIPEPDYRGSFPGQPVKGQYARINMTTTFSFTDDAGVVQSLPIHQKAIAEEFDPVWGRMSAVLGTEAMVTGNQGQNTFGFMYVDPATEVVPQGETQIWKLTHNGVDTHAIHFHLLNVQVVNRVDWAGVVKPPDPNEVGWKETVRMNPLEDIILAVRAMPPKLPFTVPNSQRVRDVTRPTGVVAAANQMNFTTPWPYTQPQGTTPAADPGTTTANDVTDYGWEYVWHCHLLGHEENDMMRPLVFTNVTNYNTADVFAPTITAVPATGATILGSTVITLSVTDAAAGRPKYLDTGVVSFSYTVNGGAPVVVNGTTATINPPAGGWAGNVVVTATATDAAAVPNVANATFNYTKATLPAPTLTAPVNPVTVQGATRNVTIRWTYPTGQGQTGFAVERAPVVGGVVGTFVQVAGPAVTSPYVNQLPAIPNTQALALQWVFRVVALQNAVRSPPSNLSALVTQLPIAPTSPNGATATANAANPRQLTVGWNDRSLNEAGFTIWRQDSATGTGGWAGDTAWDVPAVAGISPPARTYVDTGLTTGRFYRYRIQAFNAGGSTAYTAYTPAVRAP
ncbi:MAG: hypothetical protein U0229_24050 [Anaeromyxobacter sp.]